MSLIDLQTWLQAHSHPALSLLALALHVAGHGLLTPVWLLMIYRYLDKRLGLYLVACLVLAGISTTLLKDAFAVPRPGLLHQEVIMYFPQRGYSFPSGHVASAAALSFGIALWYGRRRLWAWALGYVLLMGWARLYFGVHTPADITGGLGLGLAAAGGGALLFTWLRPKPS